MSGISGLSARRVLDSRADITLQVRLDTELGSFGVASIPKGLSLGSFEAKSVPIEQAIRSVMEVCLPALVGLDVQDQKAIDHKLLEIGQSDKKSFLGANALLGVSLAASYAAASEQGIPIYRYLASIFKNEHPSLPIPLLNIFSGGVNVPGGADWQEFLIVPASYWSLEQSIFGIAEVYKSARKKLMSENQSGFVSDDGGLSSYGMGIRSVFYHITSACYEAGFKVGKDLYFGADVASNGFYKQHMYRLTSGEGSKSALQMESFYFDLQNEYPIVYLEDVFHEQAWDDWTRITRRLEDKSLIVADDLVATNMGRLNEALEKKAASGVVVKLSQTSTLTECLEVIKKAKDSGLQVVISHRTGEVGESSFISDLAVAVSANYIKAGAPVRGERVIKYNRLLEIENEFL